MDRQGNDKGTQYASVIFMHTAEQTKSARLRVAALQKALDDGARRGSRTSATRRLPEAGGGGRFALVGREHPTSTLRRARDELC